VPTGFVDLDNALAGMQESNLLILAARPGVGKTSLALNMAQYMAVEKKIPVGIFSLEMSNLELVDRLLVSQANIDAWKMKTGNLKEDDFGSLSEAMGVLADSPIYIDDTPGQSILEMRTKARRLQIESGIKFLVVDYLQLAMGNGRYESRVQEVAAISQGLKNLARELRIPVLALSQLSRAIESRGEKIPQLSDLRESGSIEQDADVVMFLYRPEEENLEDYKLSVAKHRNGPLRIIDLKFRGDRIKFFGVEKGRG
jgi:replicative DNA helicase